MEFLEVDAHWESVGLNEPAGKKDISHIMFVTQNAKDAPQKILGVIVCVKANQVGS